MSPTGAEVVISGQPFDDTVDFLCDRLGFRPVATFPADDPRVTVLSGHGLRVRVDRNVAPTELEIALSVAGPGDPLTAPNGVVFTCADESELVVPDLEPALTISHAADDATWVSGRSGMRYRDLIPGRLGGRFIASNIEVSDGGPIPDLVHHHHVRFQMIYCEHGWVDVVYEDQGQPFRMEAGDCVLQPPHIRHRVLASSAGCRVVEIGCPAEHQTLFDHELHLPNASGDEGRRWAGQRFVRHVGAAANEEPFVDGWTRRDTGIGVATQGLAAAAVVRSIADDAAAGPFTGADEFDFVFVLSGRADLSPAGAVEAGDAVTLPPGDPWELSRAGSDFSYLHVTLPG